MTKRNPTFTPQVIDSLLVDSDPYLSCDDCFEQIDSYVEAMLADPGRRDEPMEVHLRACGVCAEEAEALTELVRTTRDS